MINDSVQKLEEKGAYSGDMDSIKKSFTSLDKKTVSNTNLTVTITRASYNCFDRVDRLDLMHHVIKKTLPEEIDLFETDPNNGSDDNIYLFTSKWINVTLESTDVEHPFRKYVENCKTPEQVKAIFLRYGTMIQMFAAGYFDKWNMEYIWTVLTLLDIPIFFAGLKKFVHLDKKLDERLINVAQKYKCENMEKYLMETLDVPINFGTGLNDLIQSLMYNQNIADIMHHCAQHNV